MRTCTSSGRASALFNLLRLDELHAEGRLFEYWVFAACLLPVEDYPIYRSLMGENKLFLEEGGSPEDALTELAETPLTQSWQGLSGSER